jgi:hypothetical protein
MGCMKNTFSKLQSKVGEIMVSRSREKKTKKAFRRQL